MISFDTIFSYSEMIDENEFFQQFFNERLKQRYDSNFFQLKYQPSVPEFELIEEMQKAFHLEYGLEHLKFYWPENKGFTPDIMAYFEQNGYEIEMLELYTINPDQFKCGKISESIQIKPVTEGNLDEFKNLNYPSDMDFGKSFADMKQEMYDDMMNDPSIKPFMAYVTGQPAGTLISIVKDDTIEIDDLLTIKSFRNQGVASALQMAIMKMAETEGKQVILVADADDTPKEMYKKQQYTYVGYQLGAQKILSKREER